MASFKFVISEPQTKKAYQLEVDQTKAIGLLGKKIGDEFNGDLIGLNGYTLQIRGGTDKDGFPMNPQVRGQVKKRVLLAHGPGFNPKKKGMRKRKIVRGDTLSADIAQINVKIMKKGEKAIEEIIPHKAKPAADEKKEVKSEEKKEVKEQKTEEKPKEEKKVETNAGGEQSKK